MTTNMSDIKLVSKNIQEDFARLLSETFSKYERAKSRLYQGYLYDLDLLWTNRKSNELCTEIIIKAINEIGFEKFDTILGCSSTLGSFGPLPQSSQLSLQYPDCENLLLLRELEFSRFEICPVSIATHDHLSGKNVLIIKDIIAGGWSVIKAVKLLRLVNCNIVGVLILIDLNTRKRKDEWDTVLESINTVSIIRGPNILESLDKIK